MSKHILMIEDDRSLAEAVAYTLKQNGFDPLIAADGDIGLALAEEVAPDVVILDLMLPGLGGLEVCRLLRRRSTVPIIMLTAKATEEDRIAGLEAGADDYVTKPFSMREVIARVRAALRRQQMAGQANESLVFEDEHLQVDLTKPAVIARGATMSLAPRELSLLRVLLLHRGKVRSRQQLLDEAWGSDKYIDERTVDVHIRWLRQKIEPEPMHPRYIETVRGIGYRFAV
jgi:DNA-binding response OmpR family regulator